MTPVAGPFVCASHNSENRKKLDLLAHCTVKNVYIFVYTSVISAAASSLVLLIQINPAPDHEYEAALSFVRSLVTMQAQYPTRQYTYS